MAGPVKRIRVRATRLGYYDHARRREGDVFTIADEAAFSSKWMQKVAANTPESLSTSQTAIQREHDRILQEKAPAVMEANEGDPSGAADVLFPER
jgi:hypothetical protein